MKCIFKNRLHNLVKFAQTSISLMLNIIYSYNIDSDYNDNPPTPSRELKYHVETGHQKL